MDMVRYLGVLYLHVRQDNPKTPQGHLRAKPFFIY